MSEDNNDTKQLGARIEGAELARIPLAGYRAIILSLAVDRGWPVLGLYLERPNGPDADAKTFYLGRLDPHSGSALVVALERSLGELARAPRPETSRHAHASAGAPRPPPNDAERAPRCAGQARRNPIAEPRIVGAPPSSWVAMQSRHPAWEGSK
jgi:hypothetical protein